MGIKSQYRLNASGQTRTLSDENSPLIYEIEMNDGLNSSQYKIIGDRDQEWNLDIVKKSLLSFYPVFAGDRNRVAFLIDGYAINDENTVYFHCNFGRGGTNSMATIWFMMMEE